MDVRVGLWRKPSTEELMFWTVVLEKTLESPLDCKEIQPVLSKGDWPWVFFGKNDAKAETPVLWPPHAKSWLIGKDSDTGRDWGQKEKGMIEDEMAEWHHWLNGREFGWTPGVGDGQGGLACCDSWGCKESNTTEQLNWTEWPKIILIIMSVLLICIPSGFLSERKMATGIVLPRVSIAQEQPLLLWIPFVMHCGIKEGETCWSRYTRQFKILFFF